MRNPSFLTVAFALFVLALFLVKPNYVVDKKNDAREKYDQPMQFFAFHRGIRTPEDATAPQYALGHKTREFQKARHIRHKQKGNQARTQSDNGVIEWKERGPGNLPGRTRALLVLPNDASKQSWLAGSATGGIWKTTDGGITWNEKSADFPVYPISSFALSGTTIYAGTGESVSSIYSAIGDGIFKSTDLGETWAQIQSTHANTNFTIVTRLVANPTNPDIILASTVSSGLNFTTTSAIMKSTDGGASWTKVYESPDRDIEQILFSPDNFNLQYAAVNGLGVIKSTNAGDSWEMASTGLNINGRIELAIAPTNSNRLYASCVSSIGGIGSALYVTSNAASNWSLVDVSFNGEAVDLLGGQGFYDNTIAVDPFNENNVYYGGVNYFRSTLGTSTTIVDDYTIAETNTGSFLSLLSFSNPGFFVGGKLQVGSNANQRTVEIRFGPGISQNAHRFLVPENRTSGVSVNEYTYQDYKTIPFQAWDVTNPALPQQLMVSFRDQNRNGNVDLLLQNFDGNQPLLNSREYVYIHSATYSASNPLFNAGTTGGQETQLAYSFFPSLSTGAQWNPENLPISKFTIAYAGLTKISATTVTVADAYEEFDGKNKIDQVNLQNGVHPDHHTTVIIPIDEAAKTFQILLGNDGGVFISKVSTAPGINQGDWFWRGNGYNTSQFYGADKKPGKEEYIGGTQDNGTRRTPTGQTSTASTQYVYALGGDGFETVWHATDPNKVIGSLYNNLFFRSVNGGATWGNGYQGFPLIGGVPDPSKYPFVSKLANSRNQPDVLYAVGSDGVWRSTDFGGSWALTAITEQWGAASTFLDVEVSGANANIVWAGSGMSSTRKLHVSTNGGQSFNPVNNYGGAIMGTITKLAAHPTDPNTAFAIFSFSDRPKILRTTDSGLTWDDISGFGGASSSINGFPDVAVYCVYVRPDNPNIIWAGTEIGIVESLDNGASWAVLDDFPNVSVWDMKGQDDEVVIATHGRGIWTAKIGLAQIGIPNPVIAAVGTAPSGKLAIKLALAQSYDSIQLLINGARVRVLKNTLPGTIVSTIKNLTPGTLSVQARAFAQSAPANSATVSINHFQVPTLQEQYYDDFSAGQNWLFSGLFLQNFEGNSALQSAHSYAPASQLTALLKVPIKVGATNPQVYYRDVALLESGASGSVFPQPEFKDYAVLEATKNGIDWVAVSAGYNASLHPEWQTTFNNGGSGSQEIMKNQNWTITPTFMVTDTLFFRFRLFSDAGTTGWGWVVDELHIQVTPTGLEQRSSELTVAPNPTTGRFSVHYALQTASNIDILVFDLNGKVIYRSNLGLQQSGEHHHNVDVSGNPGVHIVQLKSSRGKNIATRVWVR